MKKVLKKVLFVFMSVMIMILGVACGNGTSSSQTSSSDQNSGSTDTASSDTASTDGEIHPGEGATKLGVILVGNRDDYGYNQGLYDCAMGAKEALGLEVMVKENVPEDSSAQAVMEQMIAQGCKLIYATSYGHREYAEEVAKAHPDVAFFVTNGTGEDLPNIQFQTSDGWDAAYINGVCAGLMTKTNELGYIGSFQIPVIISSIDAFTLGAQSVNPDVKVHAVFTGSWSDVGLQTNAVNGMISQNVDVIAQYQDYTKTIVEMCQSAGVYCIGYHVDTSELAPDTFLIGALDVFTAQYDMFKAAIDGNFTTETIRGGYAEGMAANTDFGSVVPDDVKAKVNEAIEKAKAGELNVFTGPIYNQAGEEVVKSGESLDKLTIDGMDYFVKGVIGQDK